ncbi:hypothetical protein B0H14DRAFT_2642511 [Mycena olivaceomarginata]|nr:hypothetical protein B0H14DRAFT_2642511 [Mycena olivaceomarginata]
MHPHAVPAVVHSPLRAALDRSCPSSPHLRLLSPPPAASHLRLLLLVLTQISPIPFPSVYASALLELPFARALPRLHLRPRARAVRAPFDGNRIPARSAPPPSIPFVARPSAKGEGEACGIRFPPVACSAQRRGECAAEGGRGRGVSEAAPVYEADVEADAELVDESVGGARAAGDLMCDEDGRTRTRAQALWLEKETQRGAHARTGGDAHARGVECAGPAAPSLSLDLEAGPGAGASAFPDGRSKRACVWTGDVPARGVVRGGQSEEKERRPGLASRGEGAALADRDVGAGVGGQVGAGGINAARGLYSICSVSSAGGTRSSGGLAKGRWERAKKSRNANAPRLSSYTKSSGTPMPALVLGQLIDRNRTIPPGATRARACEEAVAIPIYVKRVSAVRTPRFPFAPQTARNQETVSKIDRGDCDERTRRAIRVTGRARDPEPSVARAAPARTTNGSTVRRLRWDAQPA